MNNNYTYFKRNKKRQHENKPIRYHQECYKERAK